MRAAFWLFLGVFACATAVILIKRSTLEPALLSSLRLLFASVLLAPLFLRERTRYRDRWRLRDARRSVLPALALAAQDRAQGLAAVLPVAQWDRAVERLEGVAGEVKVVGWEAGEVAQPDPRVLVLEVLQRRAGQREGPIQLGMRRRQAGRFGGWSLISDNPASRARSGSSPAAAFRNAGIASLAAGPKAPSASALARRT